MKNSTQILILATLLQVSCLSGTEPEQNKYVEARKCFGDSLTSFFPKELTKHITYTRYFYPEGAYANYFAGIFVKEQLTKNDFDLNQKRLTEKNKQISSPFDSCNLIVGRFGRIDNGNKYRELLDRLRNRCDTLKLPIPLFNAKDDSLISTKDYSNTQIFVLSAKSGEFLKRENLTKGKGLPDNWKNGYSNGIIANANKNEITYWLIVW